MKMKEKEKKNFIGYRMNSNFLFVKNYCSNIANEESVGAWFFGFGSVFVEIQSRVGVALKG